MVIVRCAIAVSLLVLVGCAVEHKSEAPRRDGSPPAPAQSEPGRRADITTLIPKPASLTPGDGEWRLPSRPVVGVELADDETRAIGQMLADALPGGSSIDLPGGGGPRAADCAIYLKLSPISAKLPEEGYALAVAPDRVTITASDATGLFRGTQTLRQLIDGGDIIPAVQIVDQPRFRHRGMLLDCGRHFMPKEFVKRYIDLIAYHRMNVLHWHLTEDQGWRIEIKQYPKLTAVGAWRKASRPSETPVDEQGRYGGYYSQDDIREIVAYAKARFITIIPEIEMPGHALAALASHPELACEPRSFEVGTEWGVYDDVMCAGDDRVFAFIENVLTEVLGLFDSPYIHIGGDECPKARWKNCPKCQARMRSMELKDENQLQSYFVRRVGIWLAMRGRRLVGWDEILEGDLPPTAVVQAWRGMDYVTRAIQNGNTVIVSPTSHCYLDYWQNNLPGEPTNRGYLPLQHAYSLEPAPAEISPPQARRILGVEGNMWTEHAPPALVDRQVFPRLCAIAEVGWSSPERDWGDFSRRIDTHYARLDKLGVTYYIAPPRLLNDDLAFIDAVEAKFAEDRIGETRYALDGAPVTTASPRFAGAIRIHESTTLRARRFLKNGRTSEEIALNFRKLAPQAALSMGPTKPGLICETFAGEFGRAKWFEGATPTSTTVAALPDLSQRGGDERFGVKYTGLFNAPRDGVYRFFALADDAARVVIDDETIASASWDTPEQAGSVNLRAGQHKLVIEFWQIGGPFKFALSVQLPGGAKEPLRAEMLSHFDSR
ncbi:MAG: family 20 glycosylhydrolase [Phycisphaerales bacterium]|nr:family 20 glycosylhydrolase [Phycisphaerales bacterium]